MTAHIDAPTLVFRYRVVEAWGSLADALGDSDHLLEPEYCGEDKTYTILNVTTGEHTGGGYAEFVGTDQVCACGKALITKEHDCDRSL